MKKQWTEDAKKSKDYSRMINEWHANRMIEYMNDDHKGKIILQLGKPEAKEKFFPPTIVDSPSVTSKMM